MDNISIKDKELSKVSNNVSVLTSSVKKLELMPEDIGSSYYFEIYNECINRGIDVVNSFIRLSDISNIYSEQNPIMNIEKSLIMQKEGCLYHYILNDLLPHRRNIKEAKAAKDYNKLKGFLSLGYKAGVEEYLKENVITPFDGKILVCFINHFKTIAHDLDNLDQKPFIDIAVNKIIVPDDKYGNISHLMIGIKCDKEYTEVYAGKSKDILNKLKELNIEYWT